VRDRDGRRQRDGSEDKRREWKKKIVKKFNRVEFVSQICSENLTREELEKQ